jgi:hypothetical protein
MKANLQMKKVLYQIKNWRAHWRAFYLGSAVKIDAAIARAFFGGTGGSARAQGKLGAKLIRSDGTQIDLGCIGRRVVTTAGVNYLRDDMAAAAGSADVTNFKYHDSGTGTGAEAIGDTALGTPTGDARVIGTQDNSVAKQYKSVATLSYTTTLAITEHGLFSASTTGTLWDRTKFSAINVGSGDSIQFTYILSISDGG